MISKELIRAVKNPLGEQTSLAQADRTAAVVIEGIKRGVRDAGRVRLLGFGTFRIAPRKTRVGVKPKSGAQIRIKLVTRSSGYQGRHSRRSCNDLNGAAVNPSAVSF